MKLTIFQSRTVDFTGGDGKRITGFMYGAYDETNEAFEFFSTKMHTPVSAVRFNAPTAEDVKIATTIFAGKVKHKEIE